MFRCAATRVALICSSLLLAAPVAALDLGCAQRASWGSRGIPAAFATDGPVVYAADGRGITAYDATNPGAIRELSVTGTGRPSIDVTVAAGRVIALTDAAIELFAPTVQGTLQRLDSERIEATSLVSIGDFVISGGDHVTAWRVDGSALTIVSQAISKRKVEALAASGSLLVAAESGAGARIYDVTGGALRELGFASTPALDVVIHGNVLYSAAGGAGVDVIDLANPSAPRFVRRVGFGADRNMARLAVSGSHLVVADLPGALHTVDISRPLEPRILGAIDVPVSVLASSATSVLVSGAERDRYGLPYGSGAPLQIYRIAPDSSLQLDGEFLAGSGELGGIDVLDGFAYVADPPILHVLDIRSGAPREIARVEYGDSQDRVHVGNGWALVYGRGDVHLIDITDPFQPVERGVYHSQGLPPSFVTFAGDYLIEANRASGFHVLDITNPAVQVQTTGLKNDGLGTWQGGVGMGDYVYGFAYFGIKVVDLRDKRAAKVVGFIPTGTIPQGDVAFRDTASPLLAVMDGTQLRLFDLSRPLEPLETGRVDTVRAVSLTVDGSFAYLASAEGTIAKIDLSDRRNPRVVETVEGLSSPLQIGVDDGVVAVADRYVVRLLRLDETTATPPDVTLAWAPARRIAIATWNTAGNGTEYEVQWATDAAFSDGGTYRTVEASAPVPVIDETFVRVRAISGCSAGAWSATKSIRRDAQSAVSFEESGRRLVVREGRAVTLSVSLRNDGATPQRAHLTASDGMTVTPTELDVPANGRALVSVTVDSSVTGGTFSLGATVSGNSIGDFALRVSRVSPAARTRSTTPDLVLPGAGATRGANGTDWKSDLELLCREVSCLATLAYSDARQPERETTVSLSLEGGEMTTVGDVVRSLFGAEDSGGTVLIYGDDPSALLAALYTYNDAPAGRYGQRIPAARVSTVLSTATELLGIEESSTARTNLGFVNPTSTSAVVHVTALDGGGRTVAGRELTLAPFATVPLYMRDLLGTAAPLIGGTVQVSSPATVIAYASRVDQRTGDGTFTYALSSPATDAIELPSRSYTLVTAGSTPGADGSLWKTALQLRNGGSGPQSLRLTFFPAAAVARSSTVELALASGETWSTDDLMATLFTAVPAGDATLGAVRVEASSPLLGWARLYNTSSTGTYGQYVALRETSPSRGGTVPAAGRLSSSTTRRAQMFPLAQNDRNRTNLGLVETAGRFVAIRLNVYDSAGVLVAFDDRVLEPYAAAPILGFLGEMGLGGETPLRVEIERRAGDGTVEAFASRVERKTNDAVTITAE